MFYLPKMYFLNNMSESWLNLFICQGVKRTMPEKTDEPKRKVMRTARIPPYDFKARFHHLDGIHQKLKADHETVQSNFASFKEEQLEYTTQNQKIKDEIADLKQRNGNAQLNIADLEAENANFLTENRQLNDLIINLKSQICSKDEFIQKLHTEHEQVKQDYQSSVKEVFELKETGRNIKRELKETRDENNDRQLKIESMKIEISTLKEEVEEKDRTRQKLHNDIQDLKGNIRVFCRVRPQIPNEEKIMAVIKCTDDTEIEIKRVTESVSAITGKSTEVKQEFSFDQVFDENSTQSDVFLELSQLVQSALDGYNVCVFAYGQTGSGKTYTMQGFDAHHEGMIPRSLRVIFNYGNTKKHLGWSFTIRASFLEIYNETIKDLLNMRNRDHMDICFNEGKGVFVKNLTIEPVNTYVELCELMVIAHRNRTVAATDFNLHSSRSHAVTQIHIIGTNELTKTKITSMINLVDLAGSESAKTSSQERLAETKSINKSLSTLGTVMSYLSSGKTHIPYRNSKLTFLLQSCLGGNSKTLMIVHISPNDECYGESVNSLRFASQVKSIKTNSKKNKMLV